MNDLRLKLIRFRVMAVLVAVAAVGVAVVALSGSGLLPGARAGALVGLWVGLWVGLLAVARLSTTARELFGPVNAAFLGALGGIFAGGFAGLSIGAGAGAGAAIAEIAGAEGWALVAAAAGAWVGAGVGAGTALLAITGFIGVLSSGLGSGLPKRTAVFHSFAPLRFAQWLRWFLDKENRENLDLSLFDLNRDWKEMSKAGCKRWHIRLVIWWRCAEVITPILWDGFIRTLKKLVEASELLKKLRW